MIDFHRIIIGQEAVCPDGLGRVAAYSDKFPFRWIQVDTYINNRSYKWAPENVRLVPVITVAQ